MTIKSRHKIRAAAIIGMVAYTIAKSFIVENIFAKYGVNTWLFFVLDAITAVVYVIALEQLVVAVLHKTGSWRRLLTWSLVAFVAFAVPYGYVFLASSTVPSGILLGLGIVVALLLVNAAVAILGRLKPKK